MSDRLLVRGGRVIDPAQGLDQVADLLVEGGRVVEVIPRTGSPEAEAFARTAGRVIEAAGLVVAPGLIDLHAHLREPGYEYREDVESGTRAAAHGGFTAVASMPDTKPVADNREVVEYILNRARAVGTARVYPVGAVTRGLEGLELSEMGELREAGAVAVSDGGRWLANAELMRNAMLYARMFDLPVITQAEDPALAAEGAMNLGRVSTVIGLRGIPPAAEEVAVARDLILAGATGVHLHVAHVSTRGAVELIRQAKSRGIHVTAGVTPHHLSLTEDAVREMKYDSNTKVSPPLRTAADVQALIEGLRDGTIDCIATDHSPLSPDEKEVEYNYAATGIIGLESALGLAVSRLVEPGHLTLRDLISKLSTNPARVMGVPGGGLHPGQAADIIVFDQNEYAVELNKYESKARNSPFGGWRLRGRPIYTLLEGRVVGGEAAPPRTPRKTAPRE